MQKHAKTMLKPSPKGHFRAGSLHFYSFCGFQSLEIGWFEVHSGAKRRSRLWRDARHARLLPTLDPGLHTSIRQSFLTLAVQCLAIDFMDFMWFASIFGLEMAQNQEN